MGAPTVQMYVKLLLQSTCTSMCCHIYNWNIPDCDIQQTIHLASSKFKSCQNPSLDKVHFLTFTFDLLTPKWWHIFLSPSCIYVQEWGTVDGLIFVGYQFCGFHWGSNPRFFFAIFCTKYEGKYYGYGFWTPWRCDFSLIHKNWNPWK